jgi:hypothetical protein
MYRWCGFCHKFEDTDGKTEIGGIWMLNYDVSRMAHALRWQRKNGVPEEEIVESTTWLLPPCEDKHERARQIIKDLDEKVNAAYVALTEEERKILDDAGLDEDVWEWRHEHPE